jgi:hypothetical protein
MSSEDQTFRENFEEMSKELASSNCPVYAVNTEGSRAYFQPFQARGDHSLKLLSELWGEYFEDIQKYETITAEIQKTTCNYYVLGYYIDDKWDGKYHQIKVEVKREGCQVQAQGGYFNPKPFKELSEIEKQLHLIDLALSEKPYFQEPLRFPMAALPFSNKKESKLVLISEIPVEKIKDIAWQKTEITTLIFDKENNVVDSSRGEMSLTAFLDQDLSFSLQ